jgi:hypothetical protein
MYFPSLSKEYRIQNTDLDITSQHNSCTFVLTRKQQNLLQNTEYRAGIIFHIIHVLAFVGLMLVLKIVANTFMYIISHVPR